MVEKVKQVLQTILARFEGGGIPDAIAYSPFPIPNIPAARWALLNRTLMSIAGFLAVSILSIFICNVVLLYKMQKTILQEELNNLFGVVCWMRF